MHDTTTRLPYYAHWQGEELSFDLPETQPEPGVGSIIHLTVNLAGQLQRRAFVVTARRVRTDSPHSGGLLTRLGFDNGVPIAVDLDVELHEPAR
jgi:hypothetical protein